MALSMIFCCLSIKHFIRIADFLVGFEAEIRATGAKEAPQLIQVASFLTAQLVAFQGAPVPNNSITCFRGLPVLFCQFFGFV